MPGTPGPSNTVNIGLRNLRQIIIYDKRQLININTTSRDISRHQHTNLPILKIAQCQLASILRLITMNRLRTNATTTKITNNTISAVLSTSKNQH